MRRSQLVAGVAALCAAFGASAACAANGSPDNWCRNGLFPQEEFPSLGLARVAAGGKVRFLNDFSPECPSKAQRCLGRAYVVPGDLVITGHSYGDYICAFFPNRAGGSAGWIQARDLTRLPDQPAPRLEAWVGEWRDGDDRIRLSVKGTELAAEGEAFWPAEYPDPKLVPGGPHDGEMGGTARPSGASVVFEDGETGCRVKLHLIAPFLVATDNGQCGGVNVRFDGVYRRK
jgi:hypothetical protein